MRTKLAFLLFLFVLVEKSFSQDDEEEDEPATEETEYYQPGQKSENCLCVPFTQCEDGKVVTDGAFMINARKKPPSEDDLDEDIEDYGNTDVRVCGPYHVCCTDPEEVTVQPYVHHCGNRNPSGVNPRIISAKEDGESEFGEWPWQAAIMRRENEEYVFKCGGTLIDNTHILTVAHCAEAFLDDLPNLVVRLGEWDFRNATEFMPNEDFAVSEIIIHPEYKRRNYHNDVAILTLATEVSFKPHIESICLPKKNDDFTGQKCIVTGWGTNVFDEGIYSAILKEIVVPVINNADCQKSLRKTRLGRFFKLHKGFMCAGGQKNEDSCTGDGGGPLACITADRSYTLVGLVAWGVSCGTEGVPGVYVNVREYTDWISAVTGNPPEDYYSITET